jgi:hypothetical protein
VKATQYRENAERCLEIASRTADAAEKAKLIKLAEERRWQAEQEGHR